MTETSIQVERPLRADARRNHERILEAARHVFAEHGAEAQMDDVARRAGVGVGTVYRHFPTKEALMVELVRQKFRLLSATAREALSSDREPFAVFEDVLRRNSEQAASDATMQHALAAVGWHLWSQAQAEQDELSEITTELIGRAQRAGTMRPDIRAADISMLMCGVSATMAHDAREFDWRRHLELVIDLLRAK